MGKAKANPKRKRRPKRSYDAVRQRAVMIALDANGGDIGKTAAMFDMPYKTLHAWARGTHCRYLLDFRKAHKSDMAAASESSAWLCLGEAVNKAPDAAFNHLMTGFGISVDKMQLLRGEATQRSESKNLNANMSLPGAPDLSRLTPEEANALYELLQKAAGLPAPDEPDRVRVVPSEPAGLPAGELPADGAEPGGPVPQ